MSHDTVEVTEVVEVIEVSEQVDRIEETTAGATGATGATGPQGIPGGSYVYEKSTLGMVWLVTHNLGYQPAVYVEDDDGDQVIPVITRVNDNSLILTFVTPVAGHAYLS